MGDCSSKPFVQSNRQNFVSNIGEPDLYGSTLNHPFQRSRSVEVARIHSHSESHPPYMKKDDEIMNPYSDQIMLRKIQSSPSKASLVKTKQVFIHLDNNISLAALNPDEYLAQIRVHLNLANNMRFLLEYGSHRYMIGKSFENRFLLNQVWDKFEDGKHLIIRSRNQPEEKPHQFMTISDQQMRENPYLGQNPKKEDLIIIQRNQFIQLAILDPSITLQVARIILKLGSLEYFYQSKSDRFIMVDKNAESSFELKDIRQKNSDRKYQVLIRLRVFDIKEGKYIGELVHGKREGYGCFYYGKNDEMAREYYEGKYYNDKRHGKGTLVWKNGNKYVGEFHNDERSGSGILTLKDGTTIQYKGSSKQHDSSLREDNSF